LQNNILHDSDSDDDFQKDLDKETKAEFYKKIEMKEKLMLEIQETSLTESSTVSIKKLENIINKPSNIITSDEDDTNNIFLELYKN
jgi:hypothetical protein